MSTVTDRRYSQNYLNRSKYSAKKFTKDLEMGQIKAYRSSEIRRFNIEAGTTFDQLRELVENKQRRYGHYQLL